jgi:hypothetical protein
MPPGPPPLLELSGSALEAVLSHLGPHAARLRRVSRGCRDLVDASAQEIGLLVRADDGQDPQALLALLRKSTALRAVQLKWRMDDDPEDQEQRTWHQAIASVQMGRMCKCANGAHGRGLFDDTGARC